MDMPQPSSESGSSVRHFLTLQRHGILSTHSASNPGYPFGSITPYLLDEDGSFIIYISLIAEHYKNLTANSHAAVTVADPLGYEDPQAYPRATVLLDFSPVAPESQSAVAERFAERFPHAIQHELAHNFLFMRGHVARIRWIAGFGAMGWIAGDEFRAQPVDAIVTHGFDILQHMNHDHRDALVELVKSKTGVTPNATQVLMTDISATQCSITVNGDNAQRIICRFPSAVATPEQARTAIIALLQHVRAL